MVVQLSAGRVERIAQPDQGVPVRVVCRGVAADHGLAFGNCEVDAQTVDLTWRGRRELGSTMTARATEVTEPDWGAAMLALSPCDMRPALRRSSSRA